MVEDLEARTVNGELISEGFEVAGVIDSKDFPEKLIPIIVAQSRGRYTDLQVMPAEKALSGSSREINLPGRQNPHFVYIKSNKEHPDYKNGTHSFTLVEVSIDGEYKGRVSASEL